ncbi:uncharacterized protein N7458_000148 [Penicillium daleae]|uniref:Uncharacterized protein n=1 Tax=Penicillium daleae TaxID=63821 RepID=A0AAD6CFR1_9EURO|nr:uncharacterized protein N7458_000148 [Penicillium daleae]KAJ5464462.1 hypothetical protein N7458_000148 [Penicillium daleae]
MNGISKKMASQAPSTTSGSPSEGPSTTHNLRGAHTVDPRSDDDMTHDTPPCLIPPGDIATCLECLTWIAAGRRPAEICNFSHCAMERDINLPSAPPAPGAQRRVDYARQIWELYQQLDPAEQEFLDLLNEADSSDEEHPEYSEENPNGEI